MKDGARIRELEEQVADLKGRLGLQLQTERSVSMRRAFDIQAAPARLLQALLTRSVVSRELAELASQKPGTDRLPHEKTVDVFICQLRAALKPHGIEIRTEWGVGWSIAKPHKAIAEGLMSE